MEARIRWATLPLCAALLAAHLTQSVLAAGYRTANFTVDAPTPQLAKEIGDTAEHWRKVLANEWLGKELPKWSRSCPIKAKVAPRLGAGGATSFVFDRGEVFGWTMNIQGSRERILDSVLPHEVTHTIFASHFREPLPRWADEGACTTVEHRSEIAKQERMLLDFLRTRRGIPFSTMFAMKEYPSDVLPLYAQGHSLSKFLIAQHGKREFLAFLENGLKDENWPRAVEEHYGFDNLLTLQNSWMGWIRQGRPDLQPAAGDVLVASHTQPARTASLPRPQPARIVRGQNPFPQPAAESAAGTVSVAEQPPANVEVPVEAVASVNEPITPTAQTATANQDWPAEKAAPASIYDASRRGPTVWR